MKWGGETVSSRQQAGEEDKGHPGKMKVTWGGATSYF